MRIDGFSPAYVPNRTTRPDAVAVADAAVRQAESQARPAAALSQNVRPHSAQAVAQLQAQTAYQRHQEPRPAIPHQPLPWQNQQALASYAATAGLVDDAPQTSQVLGLDLYA